MEINVSKEKAFVSRMEAVLSEVETLNQDLKEIKEEADDAGFDAAGLVDYAKARVKAKVQDLEKKCKDRVALIERLS